MSNGPAEAGPAEVGPVQIGPVQIGRGKVVSALRGGLIVSCQAGADHPFAEPQMIAALARCAERGGAVGLRVDGPDNVAAVRAATTLPVVGIAKVDAGGRRWFITPTFEHCANLVESGAALVAIEAVPDYRQDPQEFPALCQRVRRELATPVLADVSTYAEGRAAADAGADLVATTLSGYTRASPARREPEPDLDLVAALADTGVPTVLEGHVRYPDQVAGAFARGAWSVVVGTAITDPAAITGWFAAAAQAEVG